MACPRLLLAIFVLIFLHQNLFSSANAWGVVEQTCKRAAHTGVDFDFCVRTLKKNPKSRTARTQGLAIIATEQAEKEFQQVWDTVEKLLHGNVTEADKEALNVCSDVYGDGVDELMWAITFIKSRSKSDAITYLSSALTDVTTCDDAFEEFGNQTLVDKLNADARKISSLALAITTLL
ncbi:hypothetical protein HPP92_003926 [Vanilla planifolia]|uniref:Pectinesterase inhibitor domain-containing protein n=1 Tax=Vanilla planifolia TaxID=51239 RepID=A0A835S436_VANPL|nr:hypothetical protein HPP92_004341 [Vanilla planifolia]KAG0503854.1 hypothetical protein HPP92_003926 [Vanilla planifolia]